MQEKDFEHQLTYINRKDDSEGNQMAEEFKHINISQVNPVKSLQFSSD